LLQITLILALAGSLTASASSRLSSVVITHRDSDSVSLAISVARMAVDAVRVSFHDTESIPPSCDADARMAKSPELFDYPLGHRMQAGGLTRGFWHVSDTADTRLYEATLYVSTLRPGLLERQGESRPLIVGGAELVGMLVCVYIPALGENLMAVERTVVELLIGCDGIDGAPPTPDQQVIPRALVGTPRVAFSADGPVDFHVALETLTRLACACGPAKGAALKAAGARWVGWSGLDSRGMAFGEATISPLAANDAACDETFVDGRGCAWCSQTWTISATGVPRNDDLHVHLSARFTPGNGGFVSVQSGWPLDGAPASARGRSAQGEARARPSQGVSVQARVSDSGGRVELVGRGTGPWKTLQDGVDNCIELMPEDPELRESLSITNAVFHGCGDGQIGPNGTCASGRDVSIVEAGVLTTESVRFMNARVSVGVHGPMLCFFPAIGPFSNGRMEIAWRAAAPSAAWRAAEPTKRPGRSLPCDGGCDGALFIPFTTECAEGRTYTPHLDSCMPLPLHALTRFVSVGFIILIAISVVCCLGVISCYNAFRSFEPRRKETLDFSQKRR